MGFLGLLRKVYWLRALPTLPGDLSLGLNIGTMAHNRSVPGILVSFL